MSYSKKSFDRMSIHRNIPRPAGCKECDTFLPDYWEGVECCQHRKYFESLYEEMRRRGLQYLGYGASRQTFKSLNGQWVFKVPRNRNGYGDNHFEYRAWKDREHLMGYDVKRVGVPGAIVYQRTPVHIGHRVTRCRLAPSGILVMERIEGAGEYGKGTEGMLKMEPTMAQLEPLVVGAMGNIDGVQGGMGRSGRFQLYDFTHNTEIDDPLLSGIMAL